MPENQNNVRYDVDGHEVVTDALLELVNQYSELTGDERIQFSTLPDDGGVSFYPVSGAVIESEQTDITGRTERVCLYPFAIVYRAANLTANRKLSVKEWLDRLGRWLERQAITIDETEHRLEEYPPLTGNRKFLSIERQTPAFLESIAEDKTEDWQISISARYMCEFYI